MVASLAGKIGWVSVQLVAARANSEVSCVLSILTLSTFFLKPISFTAEVLLMSQKPNVVC